MNIVYIELKYPVRRRRWFREREPRKHNKQDFSNV